MKRITYTINNYILGKHFLDVHDKRTCQVAPNKIVEMERIDSHHTKVVFEDLRDDEERYANVLFALYSRNNVKVENI